MKGWLVRACLTAHIPRATEYGLEGDSERRRGRKREKCAASPNKGGREWEESNPRCCRGPSGGRRLRAAIACCLPILEILNRSRVSSSLTLSVSPSPLSSLPVTPRVSACRKTIGVMTETRQHRASTTSCARTLTRNV